MQVVWNTWGPLLAASIPFAAVSWAFEAFHPANGIAVFFLQTGISLPVFLIAVALAFRSFVRERLVPQVMAFARR